MYFSPEHIEQFYRILFYTFIAAASIQLIYVAWVQGSLLKKTSETTPTKKPAVSIVICARNESDNLFKNLPLVLEQDYPSFEVIVVNHQSIDDSKYILHAFQQQYKHLRVIEITRNQHLKMGKKLPLSMGIKGAKNECIVVTDADCKPASDQWLKLMIGEYTEEKKIVLGYSPYTKSRGFLNTVIRFDTAWIGMNYLGASKAGVPYMGVGRNMSYEKRLFHESNGFKKHYSILSGDDDLFFQEVAKKGNHTIQINPDSFVYSEPKKTWSEWFTQKRRHLGTAGHYKVIKKLLLGIYPLTLFILLLTFVILLFDAEYRIQSLSVFGGVFCLKWLIQARCMIKLRENSLIAFFPFLEFIYFILLPIIYYGTNNKVKERWR